MSIRRFAAAVALVALGAAGAAGASTIFAITYGEGATLVALEDQGIAVRHVGDHEALIEGDEGLGARLRARGRIVEPVADVESFEAFVLCYPRSVATDLGRHGSVLWAEPEGAVLVGTTRAALPGLREDTFAALSLPESVNVRAWFDDTPPPLVRGRGARDGRATRGIVEDVIASVSVDSLMAHVRRLSEYPNGDLRSRYVRREECLTEAKPYIMDRLAAYLPAGAVVDTQRFDLLGFTCDEGPSGPIVSYPADNIIGILPGNGRLTGYYVVCAHYDAIASHSFSGDVMWWCDEPAPGADDNATGVATVLEAARTLSEVTFPFDIRFILFSGEELGLLGSEAYADSAAGYRSGSETPVAPPDTIYAVLNVDMIAYKTNPSAPDTSHLVTNAGSRWLADWLVETAEDEYDEHFPDFEAHVEQRSLAYSDHAPFWIVGYDALIAIEHWNPRDRNPYYHTVEDALGHVTPSQLTGVAKMVAGGMARLADPEAEFNLAVFDEDFRLTPDDLWTDESTIVRVDVHAFGPSTEVDFRLELWDGEPDQGALLDTLTFQRAMGGGEVVIHEFEWEFDEHDLGDHVVWARVAAGGVDEAFTEDNVASVAARVSAQDLFLIDDYVYPNPASDPADLRFRFNLSREARTVVVDVYDLMGQTLGSFTKHRDQIATDEENMGTIAGWNTIEWEDASWDLDDLASGVYLYRVRIYGFGSHSDPVGVTSGKFAVVR